MLLWKQPGVVPERQAAKITKNLPRESKKSDILGKIREIRCQEDEHGRKRERENRERVAKDN